MNSSEKKIQESYSDFTETMLHVYNNIKEIYLKLVQKVITEEDKDEIDFPRVPNDLEIKGLDHYLDNELKERLISPQVKIKKVSKI